MRRGEGVEERTWIQWKNRGLRKKIVNYAANHAANIQLKGEKGESVINLPLSPTQAHNTIIYVAFGLELGCVCTCRKIKLQHG